MRRAPHALTLRSLGAAAGGVLLLLHMGCSAGPDWQREATSSSRAAALVLGEYIRTQIDSPDRPVVLVHGRFNDADAADWIAGLESGLGAGTTVSVWGPSTWPDALRRGTDGAAPLREGIAQFPDAAAIVSAIAIGSYEAPAIPTPHPPLFALEWDYLPDSAFLIAGGDFEAGGLHPRGDGP